MIFTTLSFYDLFTAHLLHEGVMTVRPYQTVGVNGKMITIYLEKHKRNHSCIPYWLYSMNGPGSLLIPSVI